MGYAGLKATAADPLWLRLPAGRPFSTFGNPDHFGHFLSVLVGLSLGAFVGSRGHLATVAGALGVAISLAVASLVATRGTALGIVASVVAAPLVPGTRRRAAAATVVVSMALVAIVFATLATNRVSPLAAAWLIAC